MRSASVLKEKFYTLVPWKWQGVLLVGGTSADFCAHAKQALGIDVGAGNESCGHAFVEYGSPWVLWVDSLRNVAALAHEALHITAGVLEARGMKHTRESEEAYTYTMEDIIRAALAKPGWKEVR